MKITLHPDHEAFIRARIEAGECEDASEVIAIALDWLQHLERMREASLVELRREIEVGIAQLDRGEGRDANEVFARLRSRIDAKSSAAE